MTPGLRAYQRVRLTTATPQELVVLLYEGLVKFTTIGRRDLEARDFAAAGVALTRAIDIIGHLRDCLDRERDPALCGNLDRMYAAWTRAIARSQVEVDLPSLDTVIGQMDEMTATWRAAAIEATRRGGAK
ncbi:MAG: flagellar export chaperone FliS [Gammaproteobacteria bacterium HGW-Gammaproteobacteria-7]|jgi:flagellar protein FliS|nr:MAG: flagellar export chaperone FliS [Gammaproteobacteria bacterium HGW-Gammaproteobacteria-7]PKN54044.1 MAG: flagellar export chaperone FliS [Deltaproteobacteria bacterium HGW-Deltaproteobacteria-14]